MKRENGAIQIQRYVRGLQARKLYKKARGAAIVIQACFRGMKSRQAFRFRRQTRAATDIQVCFSITSAGILNAMPHSGSYICNNNVIFKFSDVIGDIELI